MANFKVICRVDTSSKGDDALIWEAGCPLLFEAIQISRDTEAGDAYLQGKFLNISNQAIQSFKASITVEYEDGNTETAEFKPLDADILAGAIYKPKPVLLKQGDASRVLGKIENVKLADGKWESVANPTVIPEPQPIGLSKEAIQERYEEIWKPLKCTIPLHERKRFAANRLEEHDGWWLCPCGQVNVEKDTCAKCGASLDALQKPDAEDEEALAAAAKKRKEREAQKAEERTAKRKRLTTLAIKIGVVLLAAVVLISLLIVFVVIPKMQQDTYQQAMDDFNSKQYSAAYEKFKELGDYSDAAEQAKAAKNLEDFYTRISPYIQGKLVEAHYFDGKYGSRIVGKGCKIAIYDGLTVMLSIPTTKSKYGDWSGVFAVNSGDWRGEIDPVSRELILPDYPGGENWKIDFHVNTSGKPYLSFENVDNGSASGYSRSISVYEP